MADTTTLPAKLAGRPAVLNSLADTVRATGALIEAVSAQVPDETRSVIVEIVDLSNRSLTKGGDGFDHGGFGPVPPAAVIPPFHSDLFTVVSIGRREREEPGQLVTVDVRKRTQPLQVRIREQPGRHRPPPPLPANGTKVAGRGSASRSARHCRGGPTISVDFRPVLPAPRFPDGAAGSRNRGVRPSGRAHPGDRDKMNADRAAFASLADGPVEAAVPAKDGEALTLTVPSRRDGTGTARWWCRRSGIWRTRGCCAAGGACWFGCGMSTRPPASSFCLGRWLNRIPV